MSYKLPAIKAEEIISFSNYIYKLAGIKLGPEKGYLLENRFAHLMQELQCSTFSELYTLSQQNNNRHLVNRLIDAITTHETFFFRDQAPFELLKEKVIPELLELQRQSMLVESVPLPISIWSSACSSGQEVYSIAIILKELLVNLERYRIRLLGSDISEKTVSKAESGLYNDFEINRGLSEERIGKFFQKEGSKWRINEEIGRMASFQKINLMEPFHDLGKFDIIFCRNVAVYFSATTRRKFFKSIAQTMHRHSFLIVGSTESLSDLSDIFVGRQQMGTFYYQLCAD